MTIEEAERFYKKDIKEYELERNKEFINWLKNKTNSGYHNFISIKELQKLINNITEWYEIKYPEREFECFEGARYMSFQDIKTISDVMDIRQLLFRLSHNQLCLMECGYRAKVWVKYPVYEDDKEVDWESQIAIQINRKNNEERELLTNVEKSPYFYLRANHMTGKVLKNHETDEYLDGKEDIILDEALTKFNEKFQDELDFTELKDSVNDHNNDIELRNKVLQLVALKLLYSKNTIPERGYERAKRFINEFNEGLNLNLSTEKIDEIMNRDYTNQNKKYKLNV